MPALEARRNDFEAAGAVILGISIDSVYSHDAWARHHGLSYPLLSDIHRTACQAYGIHNAERSCARRATFIVDSAGWPAPWADSRIIHERTREFSGSNDQ
ncbi:MAG: peroxiredoxin family protein [candidate division NC10 bacterium]|nr:peroxiredoxin family protein [candidate division NC10 bacterium]